MIKNFECFSLKIHGITIGTYAEVKQLQVEAEKEVDAEQGAEEGANTEEGTNVEEYAEKVSIIVHNHVLMRDWPLFCYNNVNSMDLVMR